MAADAENGAVVPVEVGSHPNVLTQVARGLGFLAVGVRPGESIARTDVKVRVSTEDVELGVILGEGLEGRQKDKSKQANQFPHVRESS